MVNPDIYNQIIRSKKNNEIVVPTFKGKQGNPVLFSISMRNKIMNIQGDVGAKKIVESNKNEILNLKSKIMKNVQQSFRYAVNSKEPKLSSLMKYL